ncbi:hypothetical protein DYB32_006766 [Aphanomyces invadans]|uniref:RRM domain-containing protein n=1 Tax=Aphanomyces invadans TaxID=157072 RepID=A0A418AQQ5_9STRA|nr:hypothetical protein DYB32_006766 [Aphanomyces invadans]
MNDQKRYRQSEDGGSNSNPSRAIVVRGLPNDCLESELLALVGPFATVEKCVLSPSKNEALVHLPDLDSATNLVTFYQKRDALLRGQKVVFSYAPPTSAAPAPFSGKNTILMVSISKMEYPVNVDVLHQVFSKYGTVMKIVTFMQRGEFRALVQLQTAEMAETALGALNGREIYTGCNTLHIQMSTHKSLNVQCNNDKMRDYFNPNLPSVDPAEQKCHSLFTLFGCFGDVIRVKVMFRKADSALIQFVDERHAQSARDHTDGVVLCGRKLRVDFSRHLTVVMPRPDADEFEIQNTRDFSNTPYHRYRKRPLSEVVPATTLLHISGIPVSMQLQPGDTVASSRLLRMFAEWGVVKKVHPIAKQPKMVLLEMGTIEEAFDAMIALDNFTFNDGRIRVSFSKSYQRQ